MAPKFWSQGTHSGYLGSVSKSGSARQEFFPSTITPEIQNTNVTFIASEEVSLLVKALFSVASLLMETFSYVRTHFYKNQSNPVFFSR